MSTLHSTAKTVNSPPKSHLFPRVVGGIYTYNSAIVASTIEMGIYYFLVSVVSTKFTAYTKDKLHPECSYRLDENRSMKRHDDVSIERSTCKHR